MNTINNIHNIIVNEIKNGTLSQKPKWHFIVMTCFIILGLISLALILFYLVSFIALFMREHLFFEAISFGPRTVFELMHTLPILLVVLVITVFLLLHVLVRHFAFAYMRPVILTFSVGITLTLLVFGFILYTDTNSRIARFGENGHIPGMKIVHNNFRDKVPHMAMAGIIISRDGSSYMIQSATNTSIVILSDRVRKDKSEYAVGDSVMMLIQKKKNNLEVVAIKIIPEKGKVLPPPMMR